MPESVEAKSESPNESKEEAASKAAEQQSLEQELNKRIIELEAQSKDKENKYLYLYADFDNFKKRVAKERQELIKFGSESVVRDLLQTLDNLENAISHAPSSTDKALIDGLNMVVQHVRSVLGKQGVQIIETAKKPFDPGLHEAISYEPSEELSGTIIREHQKGYTMHGRLLRAARVAVGQGQQSGQGPTGTK